MPTDAPDTLMYHATSPREFWRSAIVRLPSVRARSPARQQSNGFSYPINHPSASVSLTWDDASRIDVPHLTFAVIGNPYRPRVPADRVDTCLLYTSPSP